MKWWTVLLMVAPWFFLLVASRVDVWEDIKGDKVIRRHLKWRRGRWTRK